MSQFEYWQVDVFADRRGGGNPLGVVLNAQGWSSRAMQAFASWTNLVETTFVLPPDDGQADYRLRIFTPHREIPFAGHPSIGTAHALLESGRFERERTQLHQECGAGVLPIRIDRGNGALRLSVRAPAAQIAQAQPRQIDEALRLLPESQRHRERLGCMQGGRRWWLAEFDSVAAVRGWHPDHAAIAALAHATDTLGLCVFARESGDTALVVRAFPAGVGIVEDPASGAANGLIAAWIAQHEPEGRFSRGYRVSQGREIGHDARIDIVIENRDDIWVGGITHTIIRGQVDWEHQQ